MQMVLRSALMGTLALSTAAASAQGLVMEPDAGIEYPPVIQEPVIVGVPVIIHGELTERDAAAIAMMHGIVRVEDVDWDDGDFEIEGEDANGDDLLMRIDSESGEVLDIDD